MVVYIIKSTFCLVLLLGFYHLVLEKEKMHQFNRYYLLGSILFSFIVPSFIITVTPEILETPLFTEVTTLEQFSTSEVPLQITETINYTQYIIGLYILISMILFISLSRKVYGLLHKAKQNQHINYFSATVVLLKERIVPYTFLRYIFINKFTYQTDSLEEQILTHELAHVEQKHSIDILFIEILQNLFWFNPIFRYYKKAIQLNHEFLADDAVINSHKNITEYQQVLLNTTAQNNNIYLASNLNYSLTKKRLLMMTKPSSKTKILFKKLLVAPLVAGFIFAFAQRVEAQENKDKPQVIEVKKETQNEKELYKDYYYRNTVLKYTDSKGKKVEVPYFQMNNDEKKKLGKPLALTFKKKVPTQKLISDLKDSKKYAIWIDEKVVSNSVLNNYSNADFSRFFVSFVYKNARSKRFPQEYQAHLTTNSFFKTRNEKRIQDFKNYKEKRKKDPTYRGVKKNQQVIYIKKSIEKPQVIEVREQQKTGFHKNWFITIDGQKYYYTFDRKERVARYYKNGRLVNLDIVKEYRKKHKIFEQLKNTGRHYVFKSKKEQKVIDREFSDLGGMYFRMPRKNKNKVSRPDHPSKPYVTLWKSGEKFYKKRSELTKEDRLLMMPPPPPPNATKKDLKKFKTSMKAWRERTGQKIQVREVQPVKIKVIEKKKKNKKTSRPQIREVKPVSIKVVERTNSNELVEIIEEEEEVVEQHELREVEEKEVVEVKELIEVREIKEEEEVVEQHELREVEEKEVVEVIEDRASSTQWVELVEILQSAPGKIDGKSIPPPPSLKKNATKKEVNRYQKAYAFWKKNNQKTIKVNKTKRIETLLKYISKLNKRGAKFTYKKQSISYTKAQYLIRKKNIHNIYANENGDKTIDVILSDSPFVKEIIK